MSERIARIMYMEEVFDQLLRGERAPALLQQLQQYYESPLWREDYEADEQGLLPVDLKRGVLSQDAVYDFLTEQEI